MVSTFNPVLVEPSVSLVAVRLQPFPLTIWESMSKPVFGSLRLGLSACGALARGPQVHDVSHVPIDVTRFARVGLEPAALKPHSAMDSRFATAAENAKGIAIQQYTVS